MSSINSSSSSQASCSLFPPPNALLYQQCLTSPGTSQWENWESVDGFLRSDMLHVRQRKFPNCDNAFRIRVTKLTGKFSRQLSLFPITSYPLHPSARFFSDTAIPAVGQHFGNHLADTAIPGNHGGLLQTLCSLFSPPDAQSSGCTYATPRAMTCE